MSSRIPSAVSPVPFGMPVIAPAAGSEKPVNAALAYLATLHSKNSRKSMASKLNMFARWAGYADLRDCRWGEMRTEHVLAFISKQEKDGISASTSNCYLAALKGVAKTAWLARSMDHENYLRIGSLKQRRCYRLPAGRSLSFNESHRLIAGCDMETAIGARDRAVISLMLGCGLRRGEVPSLRIEKYDRMNRSLTLIGKGDKERKVFLPGPVAQAVDLWIDRWRGREGGYLFGRIYKNGRVSLTEPLDPSSVGRITRARMESANHEKATAHDLRRTFATRLLANNVDIVTVKNMMGHANIATTAMYDRRGDDAMRRAAEMAVL
ncbi:MAG: tyrosine-type recombinase/integrase [Sutterella sp.]